MKLDSDEAPITVQSSSVDLGDLLPAHARESILKVVGKYFGQLNTAAVHFSREGQSYRCTVNMQITGASAITGEALHADGYQAFNTALGKAAKQLRRKKRTVREDKGVRLDKDMVLRQGFSGSAF